MSRYGSSANDWPSHETEAELREYEDEQRRKWLDPFGLRKTPAQIAADLELLDEIDRREAEIERHS